MTNEFLSLLTNYKPKILVLGDFIRDEYVYGNVDRMSPEAPVPILNITHKESKLGCAGNVVNNLLSMGVDTSVIYLSGLDESSHWLDHELKSLIKEDNIKKIHYNQWTTPLKTRFISGIHQILRADNEYILESIPFSIIEQIHEEFSNLIRKEKFDMVVMSDYDKGSLPEKLVQKIIRLCNKMDIPTLVDPSDKDFEKFFSCTCIKPNRKKLNKVLALEENDDCDTWKEGLTHLIESYNLKHALLTLSDNGIAVMSKDSMEMKLIPAHAQAVYDVCGAGDSTLSAYALSLCKGLSPEESAYIANIAGGISCSHFGTYVVSLDDIIKQL